MTAYPPIPEGLDDGHVHEVVDRLFVAISMLEDHIASHRLVKAIPALESKIRDGIALLAEAYQDAAAVGFVPGDAR